MKPKKIKLDKLIGSLIHCRHRSDQTVIFSNVHSDGSETDLFVDSLGALDNKNLIVFFNEKECLEEEK